MAENPIRREQCIGVDPSPPARNRINAAKSVSKLAETQAEGQDLVNLTLSGYHGDASRHWFRRFFMRSHHALTLVALGCLFTAPVLAQQHHAAGPLSDEELIKSAESAAPMAIAKEASIVAVTADGKIRTIRKGTNNFTCMPDNPTTPGPDPMCMDQNALEWATAWMEHKEPPKGNVGFMYMLAGGTDASNTDPYAQKPEANNNWVETGPHVMVVGAKGIMDGYPRDAKPDTSKPYVMWPDTPYEHLMIPVR